MLGQDLRAAAGEPDRAEPLEALGVVPETGRGSWPFALLHGESLVALAAWGLGEAGVELLDFDVPWAAVVARGLPLVIHDPLCAATPVAFLTSCVAAVESGAVVVGVRPVTDTVRPVDPGGRLGAPVDRAELQAVCSPVVLPAEVVSALPEWPGTDDLAGLVQRLAEVGEVRFVAAPAAARRVVDASDLEVLEALTAGPG